jgi:transposase
VVLEATYGWYWAADVLAEAGARVHLAHPLGVKGFAYRRVKNDVRDAADLADLLRMGRLPEAWIAPAPVRELRELVRHRAKLVVVRSGFKAGVHGVLAKQGLHVAVTDLFGPPRRCLRCADVRGVAGTTAGGNSHTTSDSTSPRFSPGGPGMGLDDATAAWSRRRLLRHPRHCAR